MIRISNAVMFGPLAVTVAVALGGCGGSSSAASTTSHTTSVAGNQSTSAVASTAIVIGSFKTPQDGTLITGAGNRTLYVFKPDEKSSSTHEKTSTCYGPCAAVWPPVIVSQSPTASGAAKSALLSVITRKDGTRQAAYNGLPLYYYAADTKPGQASGNHLKDSFGFWVGMLPSGKLAPDGSS